MSEPPLKYRRLPGRGRRRQGIFSASAARNTIWLGPDHLLSLDTVWMTEEYKRFYFRDIQAITLERTMGATIWNWILGSLAVACVLLFGVLAGSFGASSRTGFLGTGGVLSLFWLVLFFVNFVRGPSCICRLRTAVQTEVLPALGRVSAAYKALAILKPLIEQAQGTLTADEVGRLSEPPPQAEARKLRPLPLAQTARTPVPSGGVLHAALYAALMLDGIAGLCVMHFQPSLRFHTVFSGVLLAVVSALSIAAFVRQQETTVSSTLRSLTSGTFAGVLAILLVVFTYGLISRTAYTVQHPGQLPSFIDFYGMQGFKELSLVVDIAELGIGIAGLALTMAYLRGRGRA